MSGLAIANVTVLAVVLAVIALGYWWALRR